MSTDNLLSDTALALLSITIALAVYLKYFSRPSPLVHPLLLGKQSDLSATRKKHESGIYRNWATGHGSPLSLRPASSLKTIANIVDSKSPQRFIYDVKISNELLKLRASNIAKGIYSLLSTSGSQADLKGVLNMLPDEFNSLLLSIAMSSQPNSTHPAITLSTPSLFAHITNLPVPPSIIVIPASILQAVLEQIIDGHPPEFTIVYVDEDCTDEKIRGAQEMKDKVREKGVRVVEWRELEAFGDAMKDLESAGPLLGSDPFSIHFWEDEEEKPQQSIITHQNVTSGIASILSLFPAHKRPSPSTQDMIASCISLAEPVGLTLALASIWSGAGFRTFDNQGWDEDSAYQSNSPEKALAELTNLLYPGVPAPTVIFLSTPHLEAWTSAIIDESHAYPLLRYLYPIAKQHQRANISDGFVGRQGLFERFFWKKIRLAVLVKWTRERVFEKLGRVDGEERAVQDLLRALIVVGPTPTPDLLLSATIHLSLPITRITTSPLSTSPVFISHFHDLQQLPAMSVPRTPSFNPREIAFVPKSSKAFDPATSKNVGSVEWEEEEDEEPVLVGVHTGPPASNVEVLVRAVDEDAVEAGGDIEGTVWIRGPTVLARQQDETGWSKTSLHVRVLKNGAFSIFPSRA